MWQCFSTARFLQTFVYRTPVHVLDSISPQSLRHRSMILVRWESEHRASKQKEISSREIRENNPRRRIGDATERIESINQSGCAIAGRAFILVAYKVEPTFSVGYHRNILDLAFSYVEK